MSRGDPSYQEFLRKSEEQQRDRDLRRQGELLAGIVKEKFEAVLKYQTALPSDGQAFPPVPPLQPAQGSSGVHPPVTQPPPGQGAFTPEQMAQLKTMLADLKSQAPSPQKASGSSEAQDDDLKPLQAALVNSLFGGKIKVDTSTPLDTFTKAVVAKRTQRTVPDAVTKFLDEHATDTTPPKPKAARVEMFWKVVRGMD